MTTSGNVKKSQGTHPHTTSGLDKFRNVMYFVRRRRFELFEGGSRRLGFDPSIWSRIRSRIVLAWSERHHFRSGCIFTTVLYRLTTLVRVPGGIGFHRLAAIIKYYIIVESRCCYHVAWSVRNVKILCIVREWRVSEEKIQNNNKTTSRCGTILRLIEWFVWYRFAFGAVKRFGRKHFFSFLYGRQ